MSVNDRIKSLTDELTKKFKSETCSKCKNFDNNKFTAIKQSQCARCKELRDFSLKIIRGKI